MTSMEEKRDTRPHGTLSSINLSYASDAMRSTVSWCRIRTWGEDAMSTRPHRHTVHELHYIYEGRLDFCFNDPFKPVTCEAGQWVLIPTGIAHGISDCDEYTRKLVIGFEIESKNDMIDKVFNDSKGPVALAGTQVFHELAQALMYKFSASNLITSVSVSGIVHALLLELADSMSVNEARRTGSLRESEDSYRISQILSYIRENVFGTITIGDVAKCLGLSVRQTSRICAQLFGCSVHQLIIQARIREVCALLVNTKYSIADISEIAGFSTPYSFSRHFSHYTGVTPSAYRRNYEIHRL